jgi:hypothetical protein
MSDTSISWIGLAISVVLMIDKLVSKSKKVKCKCCGCSEFEADLKDSKHPQTPKPQRRPESKEHTENIDITVS